jgi:hypothetical protein
MGVLLYPNYFLLPIGYKDYICGTIQKQIIILI